MTDKILKLAQDSQAAAEAASKVFDEMSVKLVDVPDAVKQGIKAATEASIKAIEAAIEVVEAINGEIELAKTEATAAHARAEIEKSKGSPPAPAAAAPAAAFKLVVGDDAAEKAATDELEKTGRKIVRVSRNGAVRKIYHTA